MPRGYLRIIGGEWRGRRIKIADEKDLRPTPDRVRETLFNWLMDKIQGAHCLDAFAGTGALGFEALSRGAAQVVMLDQSMTVVRALQQAAEILGAENIVIARARMPHQFDFLAHPFDIVFLDPPYQSDLLLPSCFWLEEQNYLADRAYIYLEAQRQIQDNELPSGWHIFKSQRAGQVYYHLAERKHHEAK